MSFDSIAQVLDDLSPAVAGEAAAWDDVLARAQRFGVPARARGRRRPLLVALAVLAVAFIPVSALAVAKDDPWWFLRFSRLAGEGPAKGAHVVVVEEGDWNGQHWALTAYRSVGGDLCTEITLEAGAARTAQGAGGCGPTIGSLVPKPGGGSRRLEIGFGGGAFPSFRYVLGPVVGSATEVRITLANGAVVTTPTVAAPRELGMPIRFYAAQLPLASTKGLSCGERVRAFEKTRPTRVVALESGGDVVATLAMPVRPSLRFCQPHRNHFVPPPELAGKPFETVGRVVGPYGARATIAVSGVFGLHEGRRLPNGTFARVVAPSRCWRVSFSNGQSQGACPEVAKRYEPELGPEVQHAGRDTFVLVDVAPRLGAEIARVDLVLADGKTLSGTPLGGVVVFAIPKDALSTTRSQRGFLIAYDQAGKVLEQDNSFGHVRFERQPVYYRSCPPGTSCYG
jgi:hypothetical protein